MSKYACAGLGSPYRPLVIALAAWLATGTAYAADPGKQACMADAKRLCAAEMHSLSRSKVRACLIVHMEETMPVCHDFMVKAREEAMAGQKPSERKPDPATQ